MRKPKGKLVALLATAMGVVLVAVGAMFWKDVYCHLLLDPRLVGRWELEDRELYLAFDRVGNVVSKDKSILGMMGASRLSEIPATYSIDGNSLIIAWWYGSLDSYEYRIEGDSLRLDEEAGPALIYHRVPDDS